MLLSTSDAEGFPSVFVEAWAHGTPVVSLKIDPDRVIARHGLGVMTSSTAKAAETIATLIHSCEERQTIGTRARDYAIRTHSAEAVARLVAQALHAPSAPMPHGSENAAES